MLVILLAQNILESCAEGFISRQIDRLAASFSASMGSSGSRKNDSGEHFCPLGMHTHLRKVMFSSSQVTNMVNSFYDLLCHTTRV